MLLAFPAAAGEDGGAVSNFYATPLSLLPPVIAIVLALITKEVYSSLFLGILTGALLHANFNPVNAIIGITDMMTSRIADFWNAGILIFLVILGILVVLMNKAGGSAAYGKWASGHIKTKRGALLSTFGLGALIFVDDYFNCLTVGNVMMPVTDKHKVSRAKLAYLIDATAAPICIIAPISSWAAAVTSSASGSDIDGFGVFLRSIPYNLYALLTILMVVVTSIIGLDFGPMKQHETLAAKGDLYGGASNDYPDSGTETSQKGTVIDLILPVAVLIIACITGMIYTGGYFDGVPFVEAFANCDASVGLAIGSLFALLFTFLLYIPRKILTFGQFAESLPEGFRQMVPALLILTFAWTLSGFCKEALGAGDFVGGIVEGNAAASVMLPALLFLIALGLAFATGTSWGTFGILIPIALSIFPEMNEILVICISAVLAGAVCGDHISPISDTTIMASTGARCNHIAHVSTQIPYALVVAAVSFVGYLLAGLIQNAWIVLAICVVLLLGVLFVIKMLTGNAAAAAKAGQKNA
ncbi:Na+/H+ antiporter NhaC family protein [Ruminococcaceae bacterium OttesenSCG-928-L11]|nr:Na+/H+ antiporter NhaC family protein [Ruminococcaceae bacterium OttesenSCG-928-L11]